MDAVNAVRAAAAILLVILSLATVAGVWVTAIRNRRRAAPRVTAVQIGAQSQGAAPENGAVAVPVQTPEAGKGAQRRPRPVTVTEAAAQLAGLNAERDVISAEIRALKARNRSHGGAAPAIREAEVWARLSHVNVEIEIALAHMRALKAKAKSRATKPHEDAPNLETPPSAPDSAGFARMISRSSGRAYYRNEIPPPLPDYPSLRGDAFFTYEITGWMHHQEALEKIVGGRRDAAIFCRINALVAPEPENPHDPHAMAVYSAAGALIGYVRREEAVEFGRELAAIAGPGAVQCRALVSGGYVDKLGGVAPWRVKLDVLRPLELR
jgi:hypothetical protein